MSQENNQNLNNNVVEVSQNTNNESPQYNEQKSSNAGSIIIIAILLLTIGWEVWYIYNEKFVSKEDKPIIQDEIIELSKFDDNQLSETSEDGTYYKNLLYQNGNLKIEFKFFTELDNDNTKINLDLFINDNKIEKILLDTYYKCDDDNDISCLNSGKNLDAKKDEVVEKVKKSIGTIKGDKYYLYIIFESFDNINHSSIYILNEKGEILENQLQFFGKNENETSLNFGSDCKTSEFLEKQDDHYSGNYAIAEDAIYYLKLSKYEELTYKVTANEYKLSVINNKITINKLGTCEVYIANVSSPSDFSNLKYEDMQ